MIQSKATEKWMVGMGEMQCVTVRLRHGKEWMWSLLALSPHPGRLHKLGKKPRANLLGVRLGQSVEHFTSGCGVLRAGVFGDPGVLVGQCPTATARA